MFLAAAHDNDNREVSQDTSSSADRACTAAWAKVYGPGCASPVPRLATDWSTQHAPSPHIQANMQAVAGTPIGSLHQRLSGLESGLAASPAGVQAEPSLAELTLPQTGTVVTAATVGTCAEPLEEDDMQNAAEHDEVKAVQPHGASASPLHGRQQPASVIPQNLTQQPVKEQAAAVMTGLSPAAPLLAKRQAQSAAVASLMQGTPSPGTKAARMTSPGSPMNSGLAGLVPSAAVREAAHKQPCREAADLEAHAMQLALKVTRTESMSGFSPCSMCHELGDLESMYHSLPCCLDTELQQNWRNIMTAS